MSQPSPQRPPAFDRINLADLTPRPTVAHGGEGQIRFARLLDAHACDGALNFVDFAELPPGVSIGRHRHAPDEEEYYLVMAGEGEMWRDGERFAVRGGDLIRNRPGGSHGLVNTGEAPLRIFVFEVPVR